MVRVGSVRRRPVRPHFSHVCSVRVAGSLRLPFMLAFWAGYGIEAVFRLLDRLSRALGDVAKTA